jgi:iron complex transport system permease protein
VSHTPKTAAVIAGGALRLPAPMLAALALLALAAAFVAAVVLGATRVAFADALRAFTDFDGSHAHVAVLEVRFPRALLAATVGAGLGVAGALMQAVTRNPLAEPAILGISWGAALVAVGAQTVLGIATGAELVPFALAGAAVAGAVVVALGSAGGAGLTPERLIVAGAAMSGLLAAVVQGILVLDRESLEAARQWLAGSLTGRGFDVLVAALPYQVAGLALAAVLARPLSAFALGEDVARGLGLRVASVKVGAAVAVVLLAGSSVAVAGPIALVGLAVPHAAYHLVGRQPARFLPASAVLGALLVMLSDVAARLVIAPEELPVGVMTALIGAPVLMHVARRGTNRR